MLFFLHPASDTVRDAKHDCIMWHCSTCSCLPMKAQDKLGKKDLFAPFSY